MSDIGAASFAERMILSLSKIDVSQWPWDKIINGSGLGLNLLSFIKSSAKGNPQMEKLVAEAERNNAYMKSLNDLISEAARYQARSNKISERQLDQILKALQGLESWTQSMNERLQSIADGINSFSRPSVTGLIHGIGGLLTEAAAVAEIRRLADNTEKMAGSLSGIDQNLDSINSRGDYFPQHVHSYIRTMIERHSRDEMPHYFFVFHQGHEWHPKFEDLQRQDPLGPPFVGYKDDLDELCAFLVDEVRPQVGTEPVLHILMPTVKPLAITESLRFPDAMRPFCVEGQKGDGGVPYVFMCTPRQEDRQHLKHIGALQPKSRYVLLQQAGVCLPFIGKYLSWTLEPQFFEDPYYTTTTTCDLLLYESLYCECNPVPPRVLGEPRVA
ncbi:uncharacterized protein F4807DRAFT_23991 [Annulohypoxylon truncatum]|uniref:uncharacterized protein n=1 Tax=Annulohypoxylon truncatum TaxID=327061 RepID=UPI002008DAF9|nr:uncharacterized protein F4807DRAFT_23991 [Annulohypoxylon truncatum]KAI1215168.1 hypothetical protein F4807DRAFT_23991 [Annulohypoxylon truncatum]